MSWLEIFKRKEKINKQERSLSPNYSFSDLYNFAFFRSRMIANATDITSFQLSTFHACIKVIGETAASIPIHIFRKIGEELIKIQDGNSDLLNYQPNQNHTRFDLIFGWVFNAIVDGEGYIYIERNALGDVVNLWLLDRGSVNREMMNNKNFYIVDDQQINSNIEGFTAGEEEILRLTGYSWNGQAGVPLWYIARKALNLGLSSEHFGQEYFDKGTALTGVIEHPGQLGPEAAQNLVDTWNQDNSGGVAGTAVLEEGAKFNTINIDAEKAQFLQTRKFQVEEICRFLNVPAHKIGHLENSSYNSVEALNSEFYQGAMRAWFEKMEAEFDRKLFSVQQRRNTFTRFDLFELLRADASSRTAYYDKLMSKSVLNANEVRKREYMTTKENGNGYFIDVNLQTEEERMLKIEMMKQELELLKNQTGNE